MKPFLLTTLLITSFVLSGCVNREQADAKLAKGCAAAAELFIEDGYQIKEIKDSKFKKDDSGDGDRKVQVTVLETDGWYSTDKIYTCIFVEQFGFMNTTYSANIYQVNVNGQTYGKKGGEILGSFQDWMALSEKVDQVLNQ